MYSKWRDHVLCRGTVITGARGVKLLYLQSAHTDIGMITRHLEVWSSGLVISVTDPGVP